MRSDIENEKYTNQQSFIVYAERNYMPCSFISKYWEFRAGLGFIDIIFGRFYNKYLWDIIGRGLCEDY